MFVNDMKHLPPVLEKKKHYLYCEASIHDFVNGIGSDPTFFIFLFLAANNHLSWPGHFHLPACHVEQELWNSGLAS